MPNNIKMTFKNSLFSVKTESSPATQFESISSSGLSLLYGPILTPIRDYIALTIWIFVSKVMSLLFNMSMFVIAFQGASIF